MINKIIIIFVILLGCVLFERIFEEMTINETDRDKVRARFSSNSIAAHNNIETLGELVAERKKVTFLLSGMDDLIQCDQVVFSLSFMSNKACEKKAAMEMAESLMKEWWSLMLANPHYAGYLEGLRETGLDKDFYFEPRRFGLKLSFWDEKVRRRPEPYVSQIRICDGKIYCYYRQKDGEALQEPIIETFEEAGWKFENVPPILSERETNKELLKIQEEENHD